MNASLLLKFNANASSKERVVNILSEAWPLTGKQVHERLTREYSQKISYQGTHKLLAELMEEGIVEKDDSKYRLDKQWLDNTKKFFEQAHKRYESSAKSETIKPPNDEPAIIEFNNFSKAVVWLAETLGSKTLRRDGENDTLIGYFRYAYWPLTFNFTDFLLLLKLLGKSAKGYPIIKHKTPFGEWIANQYLKAGAVKITFDKDLDLSNDMFIVGDYIFEVALQKEFEDYFREIHNKIRNVNDLFYHFTLHKEPSTKITVKITKNPVLAKFIKKQTMEKYFEE